MRGGHPGEGLCVCLHVRTQQSMLSKAQWHEMHMCVSDHMRDSSWGRARSSSNFSEPPQTGPVTHTVPTSAPARPNLGSFLPAVLGHRPSAISLPSPSPSWRPEHPQRPTSQLNPPSVSRFPDSRQIPRFPTTPTPMFPLCFRCPDSRLRPHRVHFPVQVRSAHAALAWLPQGTNCTS